MLFMVFASTQAEGHTFQGIFIFRVFLHIFDPYSLGKKGAHVYFKIYENRIFMFFMLFMVFASTQAESHTFQEIFIFRVFFHIFDPLFLWEKGRACVFKFTKKRSFLYFFRQHPSREVILFRCFSIFRIFPYFDPLFLWVKRKVYFTIYEKTEFFYIFFVVMRTEGHTFYHKFGFRIFSIFLIPYFFG